MVENYKVEKHGRILAMLIGLILGYVLFQIGRSMVVCAEILLENMDEDREWRYKMTRALARAEARENGE